MAARTLTGAEVALVQRWARRTRIWLWILLPFALFVGLGLPALGVVMWREHDERWLAVMFIAFGPLFALLYRLMWRSARTYGKVDTTTPLVTMTGTLRLKRVGVKTFTYAIDDAAVEFVSRDVRRMLTVDAPCVVEAISGAPVLVITARPGERARQPPKPRKPKRRQNR